MRQLPSWIDDEPFSYREAWTDYLASLRGGQALSVRLAAKRWEWSHGVTQRFITRLRAEGLDRVEPEVSGTVQHAGPGLVQPELFESEPEVGDSANGPIRWASDSRLPRNQRGERVYPEEFEEIWAAFPGKTGSKKTSYNHVRSEVNAGVPAERILKGTEAYAEQVEAEETEAKYIRAAHNFFGASQWEDALKEAADYQPQYGERTGEFYS